MKTKVSFSALEALGALNDAKSMLSLVDGVIHSSSNQSRGLFGGGREGAIFKLNPTLDINGFRTARDCLRADVRELESGIFSFNGSAVVSDGRTAAAAMKEIHSIGSDISTVVGEITSNASSMVVSGDESSQEEIPPMMERYTQLMARRRELKSLVQTVNSMPGTVTVGLTSLMLVELYI